MDCRMPEMDGYEAAAAIRQFIGCRNLPMVALTASATVEDRQRCLDAGMDAYLSKPVSPGQLASILEDIAGRCSPAAPEPAHSGW